MCREPLRPGADRALARDLLDPPTDLRGRQGNIQMRSELVHALRRLAATPASTAAGMATLGLGLAAVMLVFAVARDLVWRPSALPAADRIALLEIDARGGGEQNRLSYWSYPAYVALREALAPEVTAVAVTMQPPRFTLSTRGDPQRLSTEIASAGYFEALGVVPALGRTLGAADDVRDAEGQRVWLAHALWRDAFASDASLVGSTLLLEGRPFVVAGVMPAGFRGLSEQASLWIPMGAAPAVTFSRRLDGKTSFWHHAFVVPPPGQQAQAGARLGAAGTRIQEAIGLELGGEPATITVRSKAWTETRVDPVLRGAVIAIGCCAALLLAIVAGNLVLLMLARTDARRAEMGVRMALGAPRGRLVRALLAEHVLVFGAGLGLALVLLQFALEALARYRDLVMVGGLRLDDVHVHGVTVTFGLALAGIAMLVALPGPARAVLGQTPRAAIVRQGDRVTGSGRRWLAAGQLAFATALAIAASLAGSAAWRAVRAPLGFQPDAVLTAQVTIPGATQPADGVAGFLDRMQAAMSALPGVQHAATAFCLPVRGGCDQVLFETVPRAGETEWPVRLNMVGGDYFAALGIPLVEGRFLDARDRADAPPVVVLSAAAAAKYFPEGSPIGRAVHVGVGFPEQPEGARVVGVVGDVLDARLEERDAPMLYLSSAQFSYPESLMILKAQPGHAANALAPALRGVLARVQPDLAMWDVATMDERFDQLTVRRRFAAATIAALAGLAVALSLTGTYAVFDLIVRRRRREFGVRVALGATRERLRRAVLADAARLATLAVAAGAVVGLVSARWLGDAIPDVAQGAATQGVAVALLMATFAVLATWWPARNAATASPMEVLREE
jgi:predicted permease